nr:reverse transcriptase [Ipomoea batatas]
MISPLSTLRRISLLVLVVMLDLLFKRFPTTLESLEEFLPYKRHLDKFCRKAYIEGIQAKDFPYDAWVEERLDRAVTSLRLIHVQSRITMEMNVRLLRPFTYEEFKVALFDMAPEKASGPDGMTHAL